MTTVIPHISYARDQLTDISCQKLSQIMFAKRYATHSYVKNYFTDVQCQKIFQICLMPNIIKIIFMSSFYASPKYCVCQSVSHICFRSYFPNVFVCQELSHIDFIICQQIYKIYVMSIIAPNTFYVKSYPTDVVCQNISQLFVMS